MIIKRGLLQAFDPSTYTASVLLLEATSAVLSGVPMANHIDGTSAIAGTLCAVLFFDEHNLEDAVILTTFSNSSSGFPVPPPGRITFVTGFRHLNGTTINNGSTSSFTLTGGSSGIPIGASGVLYKAYFTSPTAGAFIHLAPHGAAETGAYATIGNLPAANGFLNSTGLLQVDTTGKIDIKANGGNCTMTLYTHGYVI